MVLVIEAVFVWVGVTDGVGDDDGEGANSAPWMLFWMARKPLALPPNAGSEKLPIWSTPPQLNMAMGYAAVGSA